MPFFESAMIAQPELPGLQLVLKPRLPLVHVEPEYPPPSALSAWYVMPRHTVIGWFQVSPFSVQDWSPSPLACGVHLPVLWFVSHWPSMPADFGQALAYGTVEPELKPRRPGTTFWSAPGPSQ